jgi:methanol--5-hydroxybenzimidazolylcobamide Co-methyltransferase
MKRHFDSLTVSDPDGLLFGRAPAPVTCGFDVTIGAGLVYPEVNFTLPAIAVEESTWPQVVAHYEEMAGAILRRAASLATPAVVLEFELLPAMTETPEWGAEITALLRRHLQRAREAHGVSGALRVTPTDIRDQTKPPALRTGEPWERLKRSFDLCVEAGADIISIESVGGKEVHDQALVLGDLTGIVLALGILAPLDMTWLWERIVAICGRRAVPGGDSACGFANTAMQLAHQRMLPEVLAAVVRAMSAVRSLVAFEQGAVGPSKDCAYEGPILKAITGCPIAMEGKSATCAHFSPVGNIAAAMCDLWSNESVQNVRLLSGSAPEAFTESLIYDCRLMNMAASEGGTLMLRNWLTRSDEWLSPQAAVLSPAASVRIANSIVAETDPYRRVLAAGRTAIAILHEGRDNGCLKLSKKEQIWLARIDREFAELPDSADELLLRGTEYRGFFDPRSYGL